MPIRSYSVLKGRPQKGAVVFDKQGRNPHYRIYMATSGASVEADVNIESTDGSEVLYAINNRFTPPNAGGLEQLAAGVTPLDSVAGTLALDFVREQIGGSAMIDRADMTLLPIPTKQKQDQLKNAVIRLLTEAVADEGGTFYAFGSAYSDPNGAIGVHDIHMNQGNPAGGFEADNGIWQDGALFMYLPSKNQWTALFIAFQTESWTTDDQGDPIGTRATARGSA